MEILASAPVTRVVMRVFAKCQLSPALGFTRLSLSKGCGACQTSSAKGLLTGGCQTPVTRSAPGAPGSGHGRLVSYVTTHVARPAPEHTPARGGAAAWPPSSRLASAPSGRPVRARTPCLPSWPSVCSLLHRRFGPALGTVVLAGPLLRPTTEPSRLGSDVSTGARGMPAETPGWRPRP